MAIGQVEIQGQITRAQDITMIKHHEDTKEMVQQTTVGDQFAKQTVSHVQRVNRREKSEYQNKKFDAKDKGSNEYHGDGGSRRGKMKEKEMEEPDGKVLLKGVGNFEVSR